MGDRGNIVIRSQSDGDIWLYTHWGGETLHDDLHAALSRDARWDDPSYLARIVFCSMLHGDTDGTTGHGISSRKTDNGHEILVVDTDAQEVQVYPQDYSGGDGEPISRISFRDYVGAPVVQAGPVVS